MKIIRCTYRLRREVGLLQHHGLGLTEALSAALGTLNSHLHSSLRCGTALWRQDQRRLLPRTLEVRDSVDEQMQTSQCGLEEVGMVCNQLQGEIISAVSGELLTQLVIVD